MRHFLKETDFNAAEAARVFDIARTLKAERRQRRHARRPLEGESWGMLFFKNSTRTRVSFEVGIKELGAHPVILDQKSTQISRGEPISDTARVLSRYLHGIVVRCYGHDTLHQFAQHGTMPVVNALSDFLHPCQIYSDGFTLAERWDPAGASIASLRGRKLVFMGDTACNMANSWILGGALFGMEIVLCGPQKYAPRKEIVEQLKRDGLPVDFTFTTDPAEAAKGADVIYTDVWVSMGDEAEEATRLREFAPNQVTADLMSKARPDALFMHCLPAHEGQEVSAEVLASPRSIIFDEAENRLHMQKAILALLAELNGGKA